jgi:predicted acyltransferase
MGSANRQAEGAVAQGPGGGRIASLDQFRGYTVLAMFVVNFVGFFAVVPAALKHHNTYCSYPDTIMPQFFFAAGLAYRLTWLKRSATSTPRRLCLRFLRRSVGLILLGVLLYGSGAVAESWIDPPKPGGPPLVVRLLGRELFQALVHIGVTALWIMPVIGARPGVRIAFAAGSAALHLGLSHWFYYDWVMTFPGIDGGPLGFLTWAVPMLAGSLAYDVLAAGARPAAVRRLVAWGLVLMLLGYALACLNRVTPPNQCSGGGLCGLLVEPPFVPPTQKVNVWTMSQRAGSVSYLTFGAGFSMLLFAAFVWACDVKRFALAPLRTLGSNALAGYVLHMVLDWIAKPLLSPDWPPWSCAASLGLFLACCYLGVRALEKRGIFLRL